MELLGYTILSNAIVGVSPIRHGIDFEVYTIGNTITIDGRGEPNHLLREAHNKVVELLNRPAVTAVRVPVSSGEKSNDNQKGEVGHGS
jgi:hypothetical protein